MKFILGKKLEMSQLFKEDGTVVPVTMIEAGPCIVTQVKTKDKDKYEAVQIGFSKKKKLTKPLRGHLRDLENFRWLREFKIQSTVSNEQRAVKFKRGDKITVDIFKEGDKVKTTGTSKGKGFQGVVKRHGFHGMPKSHGTKHDLRRSGSIGATEPKRVFKGMKMAGRMGGERKTIKNLEVIKVEPQKNLLYVKGAVPGSRNSLIMIQSR